MAEMGLAARSVYEKRFSENTNYHSLLAIYQDAISAVRQSGNLLEERH